MSVFDWLHKFTKRFDSRRSGYKYNEGRGTFEVDENLPAGHSRKQTVILDTAGVLFSHQRLTTAGMTAYITNVQFAWYTTGGGSTEVNLSSLGGLGVICQALTTGVDHNECVGDGTGVLGYAPTGVQAAVSGAVPTLCLVIVTFYEMPTI